MAAPDVGVHLLIAGRVQGVFFRKHTQRRAAALGLRGWVRNLDDGRVETAAFGPAAAVAAFDAWCRTTGSPKSKIESVEGGAVDIAEGAPFTSFDILR